MKLYDERGFLNEEGKKATKDFREIVKNLIAAGSSENEKKLIGSLLSNVIGDEVAKEVYKK